MHSERWQNCTEIFNVAVERPPNERADFLDRSCDGDEALRRRVELLLKYHDAAGDFIKSPAFKVAPELMVGDPGALIGQKIGHYKISEPIGTGGMGEVYLATDTVAGRRAALKLLPLRFTGDAERLKRFEQEARAVVGLNHPNILTVYEIGENNSIHYIASELIEGETLRDRLTRGPLQLNEALDIAIQVASALAAAHQAGIVHRDIKPENIMLRPDGYAKVLDFGIAKLAEQELPTSMPKDEALLLVETNLGAVLGTVRYMSPEQACGEHVDQSTDIWSLGVVLYEMLTGHAPFTGDTPQDVMFSILEKEPPPLARYIGRAPAELQQIIGKTRRKDRAQRYRSAHELLNALKNLRRKLEAELERAAAPLPLRWARSPVALVVMLLAATLALTLPFFRHRNLTPSLPPDKSIAVLPFENLSPDPQNAFFADGVQDEILTDLARIADLKVIGRTSVMQYKSGVARNLRKIGTQLGVAHLVEGSVERSGNRVRVNAQLVDAHTDRRLWGQIYDPELADVFAIQSEIAKTIAEQLQAKLSPNEKREIERPPTSDITAFDLYTRAKNLLLTQSSLSATSNANLLQTVDLLNQAVARDPSFFEAYCDLAEAHDFLYFFGYDHTSARLALAEAAINAAFRLRPDAAETHLARALNLYHGHLDYDDALTELELARQTVPNNPLVFFWRGAIARRQGRWEESMRNHERAIELDPRNVLMLQETALSYQLCRRYAEEQSLLDRVLTVVPNDVATKAARAFVEFASRGDTQPLHDVIDSVATTQPGTLSSAATYWFMCALAERDAAATNTALIALGENPRYLGVHDNFVFNRAFAEGVIARMTNQHDKARSAFTTARAQQEKVVQAEPNYAEAMCVLGLIDAALGRKEEALREGRRAVELLSVKKDALAGNWMVKYLAMIAAWVGDKDLACEQLASAIRRPSDLSYGQLKLLPYWDPLRGDPRFEKILEESKNPVTLTTSLPSDKSIAVLPFENLSKDEENAFFAGGMQDEILTDLAKVADLKVISRTSVMKYKSGLERNLREIANTLGVSHVVEGSVQRAGGRIRVSAQLIDARNDTHVWAEHYDRDVADVFAIQAEIAQQIANQLQAKLSAAEKAAIAERPTADPVAYAYYTQAQTIGDVDDWEGWEKSRKREAELLEKATQRDPNFALAYCELAKTHGDLYLVMTSDPKDLELAKKAAEAAVRVRPDLGETHLALARYYFNAGFSPENAVNTVNFDRAREELTIARHKLPNNPEALLIAARVDRHQNLGSALANLQKANDLDPRNAEVAFWLGQTYFEVRRYYEWEQLIKTCAASGTYEGPMIQNWLAEIKLAQGDPVAAQSLLEQVPLDFNPINFIWQIRFNAALYLRDYDAADRVIAATPAKFANDIFLGQPPESWADGEIARARGDKQKALAVFAAARKNVEAVWRDKPKDEEYYMRVAELDAGLGRKEEAIREARQAVDLQPIAKDSLVGPRLVTNLALVYAWTGERDRALDQLEIVATMPAGPTYGDLRFNPCWDSLRGDKRFDKIVAAAKAASR